MIQHHEGALHHGGRPVRVAARRAGSGHLRLRQRRGDHADGRDRPHAPDAGANCRGSAWRRAPRLPSPQVLASIRSRVRCDPSVLGPRRCFDRHVPRALSGLRRSLAPLGRRSARRRIPTGSDPAQRAQAPALTDAGVAIEGMRLLLGRPQAGGVRLGARPHLRQLRPRLQAATCVYQGNFAGFSIWDVSNPAQPKLVSTVPCITSQGDPVDLRQSALRLRRGRRQSQ